MLPDKPVTVSEQAAINLMNDLSQIQPNAQDLRVSLTDEGLTSLTRLHLKSNYLREPTIWITRQGLVARARLGSRAEHDLRALFTIETENGNPHVALERMTLNGRPVPRLVLWSLEEMVNATLTDIDWPVRISQITAGDGVLVIQGTPGTIPPY